MQDHPVKKHKLAKELSDLVNYCVSTRFQDFQVSQQKRMYSINYAQMIDIELNNHELSTNGELQMQETSGLRP